MKCIHINLLYFKGQLLELFEFLSRILKLSKVFILFSWPYFVGVQNFLISRESWSDSCIKVMLGPKLGLLFYESHAILMLFEIFKFKNQIIPSGKKKTSNISLVTNSRWRQANVFWISLFHAFQVYILCWVKRFYIDNFIILKTLTMLIYMLSYLTLQVIRKSQQLSVISRDTPAQKSC